MSSRRLFHFICNLRPLRSVRASIFSSSRVLHHDVKCLCSLSSPRRCWRCDSDITSRKEFFCPSCNVIQPLSKDANYFDIMNSPQSFDIQTSELTKQFRELQWKLHPDKFSGSSKDEITLSDEQSSVVNKAYSTLLKPLSRGLYLLKVNGMSIAEGETSSSDPEFLMEIMEINEELWNASPEKMKQIAQDNKEKLEKCINNVSAAFKKGDLVAAREGLVKMKYYSNIDNRIRESDGWS